MHRGMSCIVTASVPRWWGAEWSLATVCLETAGQRGLPKGADATTESRVYSVLAQAQWHSLVCSAPGGGKASHQSCLRALSRRHLLVLLSSWCVSPRALDVLLVSELQLRPPRSFSNAEPKKKMSLFL